MSRSRIFGQTLEVPCIVDLEQTSESLHEQRLEERLAGMDAELRATREQLARLESLLDRTGGGLS